MRWKMVPGNITATLLPDQLYWKPTLCSGDLPYPTNADPEEATHLCGEGGPILHSNMLPHHPAPVVEEVHRQGQSWVGRPCQENTDPDGMPKA